jgi:predicted HAD superfamily Cof-like phosphohydrolase
MTKVFTDVAIFLKACGQEYPAFPQSDVSDLAELYKKLIIEEYSEFLEADANNDDVERLDACFDMIWVIVGYMKSRGWDCEAAWDEGAYSNLAKIDKITGKVIRREDGKILKPEGWKPPNFKKFTA